MEKQIESCESDMLCAESRRRFLKKVAYIAPAIATFSLALDARARTTHGSPPPPPSNALVTRSGKEIRRR